MTSARIAIAGMGAVSAAGLGVDALWTAARDGVSAISTLDIPRTEKLRIRIGGQLRDFDPAAHLTEVELRRAERFSQLAQVAALEALGSAGLAEADLSGPRTAAIIGSGIGGMTTIDEGFYEFYAGNGRMQLMSVPRLMPSAATSNVSIRFGITGPCFAVTSACASASQSIGIGAQLIRAGVVDRAVVGGSEACLTPGTIRGWEMLRVLSPDACRPFASDRSGTVLGEGAGVFVLESEAAVAARGGTPIAWLAGYGTSSDAKDIVQPDIDGATSAMRAALADAELDAGTIDYVNAHGTGTVLNDLNEALAINLVFGERTADLPVSSTKSLIGHTLGAGGALELIVTVKAVSEGIVPPQTNVAKIDPKCQLNLPATAVPAKLRAAMSNSFAFGGINACLVVTAAG